MPIISDDQASFSIENDLIELGLDLRNFCQTKSRSGEFSERLRPDFALYDKLHSSDQAQHVS